MTLPDSHAKNCMTAVDTNILLYGHDPRDRRKQTIALDVIDSIEDGVLLWQVACEYLAAARKLAPYGLTASIAWRQIAGLREGWDMAYPTGHVLDHARHWHQNQSISLWDALILAACEEARITTLYSEDINANMVRIPGLTIVNPFA